MDGRFFIFDDDLSHVGRVGALFCRGTVGDAVAREVALVLPTVAESGIALSVAASVCSVLWSAAPGDDIWFLSGAAPVGTVLSKVAVRLGAVLFASEAVCDTPPAVATAPLVWVGTVVDGIEGPE